MESVIPQLLIVLRRLSRTPVFTTITVAILAVGIGSTTAIFSVVNGILLKPLPYPQPEELIDVRLASRGLGIQSLPLSTGVYLTFQEENRVFRDIALYDPGLNSAGKLVNITGLGEPARVQAFPVTANMLSVLRITPLLGRAFTEADELPSGPETAILTYGYWRREFGGRPVVGNTIDMDGKPCTIIGVLPQRFQFLDVTSLAMLLPLKLDRAAPSVKGGWDFGAIARLKSGASLAQANTDVGRMLDVVGNRFFGSPGRSGMWRNFHMEPNLHYLKDQVIGGADRVLWVVMAGMGFLLIIGCANLANLLLVRADGRREEMATRVALGASRSRIMTELLSESLVLTLIGGLLGLGVAYASLRLLIMLAPASLPRLNEIGIDSTVLLFTLVVWAAALLFFGSAPAIQYAGGGLGSRLREGGRSMSESRAGKRSRSLLVIVQVALAFILVVSSGLMIRTYRALSRVDPGFRNPGEVQTFRIYVPEASVKDSGEVTRTQERIAHALEAIPGTSSVGISRNLPMDGSAWGGSVEVQGHVYDKTVTAPRERFGFFAPGFLKTLGIPLIAGRDFTWSEIYNEIPVAMVSENFARQYWGDPTAALGKQIRESKEWREIIGVVGDVHQDGLDKEAPVSVYWPILMDQIHDDPAMGVRRDVAFAIRTHRSDLDSLAKEMRYAVRSSAPNFPLFEMHTLNFYYTRSMARTTFTLVILVFTAGMALILGAVGLYGAMAHSVVRRRHEIGIRMALGAQKRDALKLVVGAGVSLTVIGIGIGIGAALGLTRFLSSLLFDVRPVDAVTFITVSLFILAIGFVASYTPGQMAAKVDPAETLKQE